MYQPEKVKKAKSSNKINKIKGRSCENGMIMRMKQSKWLFSEVKKTILLVWFLVVRKKKKNMKRS